MKNFISFIFMIVFGSAVFAAPYSELTITISENANFFVVIDGNQFNSYAGAVVIPNLINGRHGMDIFKETMTLNGVMTQRLYSGVIDIAPNKKFYGTIDRFGTFIITGTENMVPVYNSGGYGYGYGHGNNYYGNNGHHSDYSHGNNYYKPFGMPNESFNILLSSMRREAFDETRLRMAITAVSISGVTSYQLRELMLMLTFDSNRLKLAKTAYAFVADKGNIFIINDAFVFNSNATEFYKYIGMW